ncbi:ArsO family NAD(P)H-dependent flavin-containing monooxygenase [Propionibacteriaceae bacterium Y1685]|uniref:ArsO family NAD(P)H-dependent flavin-containing monooxygenase n=1 Tax=Microlunatus sp. Y1700 TaxID=3418487 RepID=UPI003B7B195A
MTETFDVVVIGGGQAGLAIGHQLRRQGHRPEKDFVILDAAERPGGAWQHLWPSMTLFSPAEYSSLPGLPMPSPDGGGNPGPAHVVDYLTSYEKHHELVVRRPVRVQQVRNDGPALLLDTSAGPIRAGRVVNATGSWTRPWVPAWSGQATFPGRQWHTASYRGPEDFADLRVAIVGGGNSAAQILAEVSAVAQTRWITRRRPRFMADEVDGRVLFQFASARHRQQASQGEPAATQSGTGVSELGDIVVTDPVKAAREMGVMVAHRPFERFDRSDLVWDQGSRWTADAVIWCTGFRPELRHLRGTGLIGPDRTVPLDGLTARADPRQSFIGYGDWTGSASATLVGAGRTARQLLMADRPGQGKI